MTLEVVGGGAWGLDRAALRDKIGARGEHLIENESHVVIFIENQSH